MNGLQVAIVGGGIGGLSAAIALRDCGYDVAVYERADELRPIGAGICMWPNGAKAANALGLEADLDRRSPELEAVRFYGHDGAQTGEVGCGRLVETAGTRPYPLARSDLHEALLNALDDVPLHLGKECVGVRGDAGSATVEFADGSAVTADVVVAADGVWSAIRASVVPAAQLRYLYTTWLTLLESSHGLTDPHVFSFYSGPTQRVGALPVSDERVYVFLDAPVAEDWSADQPSQRQLVELFGDWDGPVGETVAELDDGAVTRLAVCDLDPLESFVAGRVVLIGDAAHATAPTLGQGGALAMEDAIVLARYLNTVTVSVDDALARYDAARRARAQPIVMAARARARSMVHGAPPEVDEEHQLVRAAAAPGAFMDVLETIAVSGPCG